MPKYYKILDCPEYEAINKQILNFVITNNLLSSNVFWNHVDVRQFVSVTPLLTKYLQSMNLYFRDVAVTIGTNKNCCPLHTDTPPAKIKLNWPIMNTKNTFTRWFHPKTSSVSTSINQLGGTVYYDYSQLVEVEKVELIYPCLIDATVPHDVLIEDSAQFPRVGLQCMFFKEPVI